MELENHVTSSQVSADFIHQMAVYDNVEEWEIIWGWQCQYAYMRYFTSFEKHGSMSHKRN